MKNIPDEKFFDLADAHINLANNQVISGEEKGRVSSAFMYASSRYNASLAASFVKNKEEMIDFKEKNIEYFTEQYIKMFTENIDDYISNFDAYIKKDN